MASDFKFTKFFIGDTPHLEAVAELKELLDECCSENGLQPVPTAHDAHFVAMIVLGKPGWLHFDSKGHYLALDETDYEPVVPNLSRWRESVTHWFYAPDSYTLRRYHHANVIAAYANLNSGNRFESIQAAEDWVPKYEEWKDLLDDSIDETAFYQTLPPPTTADTPTPTYSLPASELGQRITELFNWDERLNETCINASLAKANAANFGYQSSAGDYEDPATGIRTIIRCYAHPNPGDRYSRHWQR